MTIKEFIVLMGMDIPVTWDRFTEVAGNYDIYGWINRPDGQRDFVLLQMYFDEKNQLQGGFTTSSAKWSEAIYKFMYGRTAGKDGHVKCQSIGDLKA